MAILYNKAQPKSLYENTGLTARKHHCKPDMVAQMWWLSHPWPQQSGGWLLQVWGQSGLHSKAVSQKGRGKGGEERGGEGD